MPGDQHKTCRSRLAGLLTQPLIPSPIIKWILPARLRDKHHNDVVFIGERRIQIKEALPSGHLQDVVEKSDIEGSLIGAKVINVSTQLPWETQAPTSSIVHPYDRNKLPPQILFLVLDSNELLFMYCSEMGDGPFVSYNRALPRDINIADKYGRHIAVDPKSRAVAVSASRNFFGVLWLKSPDELQMQMAQGKLNPLSSESFFQVTGDILFMEFLYPKDNNDKRVILLLIIHNRDTTRSMVFEWDGVSVLNRMTPKRTSTILPQQDQLPSMVIPLAKESSYLLVTTNSMAMYTPSSSSRPMRYPPIIPDAESSEAGLWTRWARPSRNWMYSQRYDGIFLCQEKGWIYYLEFGNDGELETQTSLGQLHCDVDTAFDILDMGHEGGDFILAAGSQGDGGLFVQEARDHPRCVQRFLNWAPVPDAVVIPSAPQDSPFRRNLSRHRDRLFVCSTSASGNGAITELRYGIEAQIGVAATLGGFSSIRDMWAVSLGTKDSIYLVASDPLSSLLLHTTPDMRDGITALEDDTDLEVQQTLAMDCTPSGAIVRVTERAVHFFVPADNSLNSSIQHDPLVSVTAAIVDGPNSTVIMTTRTKEGNFLHFFRIITTGACVTLSNHEAPYPLQKEPICISHQNWGKVGFIFLGTSDGTVLSFEVDNESGVIRQHADTRISVTSGDDISLAIESLAVVRTLSDDRMHPFLFCGLRSGILVPFEIDTDTVNFRGDPVFGFKCLKQRLPRRYGKTSIKLKSHNTFALFICGDDFWRVSYAPGGNDCDYFLSRVWITDQNCPAYFPTRFNSFALVDVGDQESGILTTYLFCFADGQLLVCSLDQEAKTVPRRIDMPGNPSKLTYSRHLRSLIVSYSVVQKGNQARPLDLSRTACIEFVDPDAQVPVVPNDVDMVSQGLLPWRPHGVSGEKITCILDWMPCKGGNEYHLIAIGTSVEVPHQPNKRQGRLMLIHASRDVSSPGQITCIDKHTQWFKDPIYAMASYSDSVIVASGKRFFTVTSRNSLTKWNRNITALLPSPAVAMTVAGDMIYVTSSRHSVLTYVIVNGDILASGFDSVARDGLSHTLIPGFGIEPDHLLVSSRGGAARIFTMKTLDPPVDLVPRAVANLPVSLIEVTQGCKSPASLVTNTPYYGFGINGTVYRLLVLRAKECHLLQLLLNICLRDEAICPSLSRRHRYLDAISQVENSKHIDGTILTRLVSRDSKYLDEVLRACDRKQFKDLTPETVKIFMKAIEETLGADVNHTQALFTWLRRLLHIEL